MVDVAVVVVFAYLVAPRLHLESKQKQSRTASTKHYDIIGTSESMCLFL